MKHAEIIVESDKNNAQKVVEVKVADGKTVYLIEQEYTEAELDAFNVEKEKMDHPTFGRPKFFGRP